jgi:hypothetical protein
MRHIKPAKLEQIKKILRENMYVIAFCRNYGKKPIVELWKYEDYGMTYDDFMIYIINNKPLLV